jgi:periplasmic divalent cation tolerance protein
MILVIVVREKSSKSVMGNKSKYIQILTTVARKSEAELIAITLSKKNLSACTQIVGPIMSVYKWKGKLKKSKEWMCIIKTKGTLYKNIEKLIKNIHSYEVPEIIVIPIIEGNKEYLEWIQKEV